MHADEAKQKTISAILKDIYALINLRAEKGCFCCEYIFKFYSLELIDIITSKLTNEGYNVTAMGNTHAGDKLYKISWHGEN